MSAPPEALILTRGDVAGLMSLADWLEAAEAGFRAAAEGRAHAPPPMHIDGGGGAFHAKGASLDLERRYVALKFNGNFPGNPGERGLPTIQGAILLCDGETGSLLAVIDSGEVTLRRTAAATALAAKHLARPDSSAVLICGCGAQAAAQLAALRNVLPLRSGFAWDRDPGTAQALAAAEGLSAAAELEEACARSDVIVACTTAHEPYLEASFVTPGTFVAAVGADSPEKSEICPELMAKALVVADSVEQCAVMGDLRHAIAAGAMRVEDVYCELSELVGGSKRVTADPHRTTLFDSTGTALQDVAAAVSIYERALGSGGFRSVALAA